MSTKFPLRLFVSTEETYLPHYPISGANYIKKEGLKVKLDSPDETVKTGYITCSTEEEAIWFCKAIFTTMNNPKSLVIDYLSKSVYTLANQLKDVCFVYELNDPARMQEIAEGQPMEEMPIKQIEL